MDVLPMCLYAHLLYILYLFFLTWCLSVPLYIFACGLWFLFVSFFFFTVLCQQLLKYLRDGFPTEVHHVPSLGKLSAFTNLTEKGYARLKQFWEPCARSLCDVNWLSSTEVNEACQIMAAEALKTYQMKCYTEMHRGITVIVQKPNKLLKGFSEDICSYLGEMIYLAVCRTSLKFSFFLCRFYSPILNMDGLDTRILGKNSSSNCRENER